MGIRQEEIWYDFTLIETREEVRVIEEAGFNPEELPTNRWNDENDAALKIWLPKKPKENGHLDNHGSNAGSYAGQVKGFYGTLRRSF